MRKFGLIGFPLGHSFSRKYFTDKFAREGIAECSYHNFPLENIKELPGLVFSEPDLCGLNVTIPYKSEVLDYIDTAEAEVDEIRAANVLKIRRQNNNIRIYGFNSDIKGIHDSISPVLTPGLKNAIILGTGGSSKAVAHTLGKLGLNVRYVSRFQKNNILSYSNLDPVILSNADIIINTTPLGMYPEIHGKPDIDYDLLEERHILFDLVYNPEETAFLREGKKRGCRIITGLGMLYAQAERSWEIWNDPDL
jgi:shikimate dehydrogenase